MIPQSQAVDEVVKQGALVERHKGEIAAAALVLAQALEAALLNRTVSRLRRLRGRGRAAIRTKIYRDLLNAYAKLARTTTKGLIRQITASVRELAVVEAEAAAFIMEGAGALSAAEARSAALTVFDGLDVKGHLRKLRDDLLQGLQRTVTQALNDGATLDNILDRLEARSGPLQVFERNLRNIAETAAAAAANEVRMQTFLRGGAPYLQWTAVLDNSTCVRCASMDGTVWPAGREERPPLHILCRCGLIPVDNPEGAGKIRFEEWLEDRGAEAQDEVLGPARAKLWRQGKLRGLDPKLLLDANRRLVPLEELRKRLRGR